MEGVIDTLQKAKAIAEAALAKKAEDVVILEVRGLASYTDYLVLCSGRSDRQVQAIADAIESTLRDEGEKVRSVEGFTQGHWVLLDYADVVAHVFHQPVREFYDLDSLWADAPRIPVEDQQPAPRPETPPPGAPGAD